MTVSLELSGPEASRPYIDAAQPDHPSLLDPTHRHGRAVRRGQHPERRVDRRGRHHRPSRRAGLAERTLRHAEGRCSARCPNSAARRRRRRPRPTGLANGGCCSSGQDRASYPDAIRDWAAKGADSEFALTPDEVVAPVTAAIERRVGGRRTVRARQPPVAGGPDGMRRSPSSSSAIGCSPTTGRTSARRGRSSATNVSVATYGRWVQAPIAGEEADWPFESDFRSDVERVEVGGYYPKTI